MNFFFLNGQVPFNHVQHDFYRDTFVQNRNYMFNKKLSCPRELNVRKGNM